MKTIDNKYVGKKVNVTINDKTIFSGVMYIQDDNVSMPDGCKSTFPNGIEMEHKIPTYIPIRAIKKIEIING